MSHSSSAVTAAQSASSGRHLQSFSSSSVSPPISPAIELRISLDSSLCSTSTSSALSSSAKTIAEPPLTIVFLDLEDTIVRFEESKREEKALDGKTEPKIIETKTISPLTQELVDRGVLVESKQQSVWEYNEERCDEDWVERNFHVKRTYKVFIDNLLADFLHMHCTTGRVRIVICTQSMCPCNILDLFSFKGFVDAYINREKLYRCNNGEVVDNGVEIKMTETRLGSGSKPAILYEACKKIYEAEVLRQMREIREYRMLMLDDREEYRAGFIGLFTQGHCFDRWDAWQATATESLDKMLWYFYRDGIYSKTSFYCKQVWQVFGKIISLFDLPEEYRSNPLLVELFPALEKELHSMRAAAIVTISKQLIAKVQALTAKDHKVEQKDTRARSIINLQQVILALEGRAGVITRIVNHLLSMWEAFRNLVPWKSKLAGKLQGLARVIVDIALGDIRSSLIATEQKEVPVAQLQMLLRQEKKSDDNYAYPWHIFFCCAKVPTDQLAALKLIVEGLPREVQELVHEAKVAPLNLQRQEHKRQRSTDITPEQQPDHTRNTLMPVAEAPLSPQPLRQAISA